MPTFTINGTTYSYSGDVRDKIFIMNRLGIEYTPTPEEQDEILLTAQLKTEYQTTIDTLLTIENTVNPTNAQVIQAVKFLAKTLRFTLKFLAKELLN